MSSAVLLKASRTSGVPFYDADQVALREAIGANFDKVVAKLGVDPKVLPEKEVAERARKLLERTERIIARRFPVEVELPLFYSKEEWMAAIEQHGTIALAVKDGELRLYVIDSAI